MSKQTWWYVARASGITAWAMLSVSVVLGLLAAARLPKIRVNAASMQRVHQHVSEVTMVFIGVHIVGLVADTFVHFSAADVLVPFASAWHPLALAFGVVAMWILIAVCITSWLRNRLSRRVWHGVHMASYVAYVAATVHLLAAGTDAATPVVSVLCVGSAAGVAALTILAMWQAHQLPSTVEGRIAAQAAREQVASG